MNNITINDLKECESYSDCARKLGYNYYNGRLKKIILKICKELNFDIEEHFKNLEESKKKFCLNCGKELKKGQQKFCSSSCSATYNNQHRVLSEEAKRNVSNAAREVAKKYFNKNRTNQIKQDSIIKICPTCGKEFKVNASKKNQTYCSQECVHASKEYRQKLASIQNEKVENGTHSGWKSRNITSYPEQFWIKVLNNNEISFTREVYVEKYFLDFVIVKNNKVIDLEIDGKQHEYKDRKESDKIRDEFLKSKFYLVYRIKWNEINSDKGKSQMKEKINKFLEFYNSL